VQRLIFSVLNINQNFSYCCFSHVAPETGATFSKNYAIHSSFVIATNETNFRQNIFKIMTRYPMIRECGARARTKGYKPCKRIAMKNGRCPLHGGLSTGAKTKEGKHRQKMASWKHGLRSKEAVLEKKCLQKLIRECKSNLKLLLDLNA
jgi:hypothetical protein